MLHGGSAAKSACDHERHGFDFGLHGFCKIDEIGLTRGGGGGDILRLDRFHPLKIHHARLLIGPARNFEQINACGFQPTGNGQAVFKVKATFLEVSRIELH